MDITKFEKFDQVCCSKLPDEIDKILNTAKGKKACAIGFITTDDFYGFYLTWDYSDNIDQYFDWKNTLQPDFLYQPVVDIVEDCGDIDFCNASEKKWEFAQTLLSILEKSIKQIPDEIFQKNGFQREDILFFSTMSDGDYIKEMMEVSVKMFNTMETPKTQEVLVHDGISPILVAETEEDAQFRQLWNALVPVSGRAKTAQGEIIRIAGRIQHEFLDNGGINWDDDFRKMLNVFPKYLYLGNAFCEDDIKSAELLTTLLITAGDQGRTDDFLCSALCACAVAWVRQNPLAIEPLEADYNR